MKSWFFDKINKTENPLGRLKKKRERERIETNKIGDGKR
jgi:hypothetical protein